MDRVVIGCGGQDVVGAITLPGVRRSVRYARLFLRDMLPPGHPLLDDLVTVGSETVCNAITHTASGDGGRVTVSLLTGPGLYRLEVADDGADGKRPYVKAECGDESGRGMRVVEALSERWGFRVDGHRTVVWAEFGFGNSRENSDRGLSPCPPRLVSTACKEETDECSRVQYGDVVPGRDRRAG
ncbi:ATP-binding protein [Actinomadura decatromicini]|uniref:ATP-binding protein n=1 Tax=Actinomadura decatromicini TaxID=2604572 RepID=A0A5D3FEF8_9ACTN|nr:ATP-binding protein [Actinomadura decatromicini]TYK46220.1 ATP-binding protein [Actinomadura decatromicini]